eukprot:scaffold69074_cov18-Tisochrysis_lutea.AAC.6
MEDGRLTTSQVKLVQGSPASRPLLLYLLLTRQYRAPHRTMWLTWNVKCKKLKSKQLGAGKVAMQAPSSSFPFVLQAKQRHAGMLCFLSGNIGHANCTCFLEGGHGTLGRFIILIKMPVILKAGLATPPTRQGPQCDHGYQLHVQGRHVNFKNTL